MAQRRKVFIDSDAFIAFIKSDDTQHAQAREAFEKASKLQTHFYTSNYVFSEVVTVLSQRVGRQVALEFIEIIMLASSGIGLLFVDQECMALGIEIYREQSSKNVSFVDCCNMALVRQHRMDLIWSFDSVYKSNGFNTLAD